MIFVTVGTHEQQFNRLVKYMDELKGKGVLEEEVVLQTGFSTYEPKHSNWSKLFSYRQMVEYVEKARIVITHGGPSSFVMPLQLGKIPVVVPRQKEFNEHVNNHQVEFCRAIAERQGNILVVEEIGELGDILQRYEDIVASMPATMRRNNTKFCQEFEILVDEIMKERKKS